MLSIRILRLVVAIYFSRLRSGEPRRSAPRGSVNHFLRVGRSSVFRLLHEVRAGEPHISGQGVKLVFVCDVIYRIVLKLVFNSKLLSAAFEL